METIRIWIEKQTPHRTPTSTSVDLPFSDSSKTILEVAVDEATRWDHRHIGTEHLFLALFSVEGLGAKLLAQTGADPSVIRARLAEPCGHQLRTLDGEACLPRFERTPDPPLEIHGIRRNTNYIHDLVKMVRSSNWHWHKMQWKPRDIVIHRADAKFSFEMSLASDAEKSMVVERGRPKDRCFICGWELFEAVDEHGRGYTDGRNWLCMECCERFIQKDFSSSSHPAMT